jgi:hypothetical protein
MCIIRCVYKLYYTDLLEWDRNKIIFIFKTFQNCHSSRPKTLTNQQSLKDKTIKPHWLIFFCDLFRFGSRSIINDSMIVSYEIVIVWSLSLAKREYLVASFT